LTATLFADESSRDSGQRHRRIFSSGGKPATRVDPLNARAIRREDAAQRRVTSGPIPSSDDNPRVAGARNSSIEM